MKPKKKIRMIQNFFLRRDVMSFSRAHSSARGPFEPSRRSIASMITILNVAGNRAAIASSDHTTRNSLDMS
jgi:hypothetical protein